MMIFGFSRQNASLQCRTLLWSCLFLMLAACQRNAASNSPAEVEKVEPLFPYHESILAEKAYLDSIPMGIVAQVQLDGKDIRETIYTSDSLQRIWASMLEVNPNSAALRDKYTEQSFVDMTLGYHTFVIETKDSSLTLQRATVQVHPETNVVTNLTLESRFSDPQSGTGIRRVLLRRHKGLQQTELFEGKNGTQHARVTNIKWGE